MVFQKSQSGKQKSSEKKVRFSQTGCIDHAEKSIQPVCFHILIFIVKYVWDG